MGEYNYMMGSSLPSKQESATESSSKINNPRVSSMSASSSSSPWLKLKDPRIVRVSRGFGGKDRHSKVSTIRGLRDRRVRLSVPTAIQLYDLQDRLGLNQPSKVVDWLLDAAKDEIEELPPLPMIDPVKLGEAQWMEQTSRFEEIEEQEQEHVAMESDLMYQRPVAAHDANLLFPYQMDPQQHQVVEDYNPHQGFQTQPNNTNGSNYLPLPYLRTSLVENIMDPSHHVGDHHHHHHQLLQTGSSGSHNFFFNSPYSVCHHHSPSGERIPLDFDVNARATAPPSDKNED